MSDTKIGKILNKLLADQNLKISELARRVQLPQPTIQRIAAGVSENPHISSLQPIAEYFAITVDQLKGLEPIAKFDMLQKLPLIAWHDAPTWGKKATNASEYMLADIKVSEGAYALKVLDGAMDPIFPRETILIVDPTVKPKDRSYVIALNEKAKIPIFRQLIINGPDKFLKPSSPDTDIYKMTRFKDSDTILAVVVQARRNYLD